MQGMAWENTQEGCLRQREASQARKHELFVLSCASISSRRPSSMAETNPFVGLKMGGKRCVSQKFPQTYEGLRTNVLSEFRVSWLL